MRFRVCAGILALVNAGLAADIHVIEEIVAKVNGDIITRGDVDTTRHTLEAEMKKQGLSGAALDKALKEQGNDALRDQIDQLLLVQHGKDLNINVDSDVTKRIAQIQVDSKIGDPDKFHDYIRDSLGMPYEDFKAKLKDQILTQRVISQEVMSRINTPHSEVEKYYQEHQKDFVREEQVFLREILISTDGKTPEQVAQAEKRAKELVARARKGEKFAELARQYSDAETKESFGELPPYKKGQLVKELEDVVFKEKKGYVSDPIKMKAGFEILKIEERFEAGQAPLSDVENEIMEKLSMPQLQPKVRELLTKLRLDAFLEVRAGYIDTGAAPGKSTAWQDPAQLRPETTTKEEVASHIHRKRLLWMVPIPGTDKNGTFVASPPSTGKSASNAPPAGSDTSSSSPGGAAKQ